MRVISWQKSISYNGYTSLFVKEMKLYEHLSLQVLNQVLLGPPQSILCTLLLPTGRAGGASLSGHHAPLTLYSWATRELRGGREGPPGAGSTNAVLPRVSTVATGSTEMLPQTGHTAHAVGGHIWEILPWAAPWDSWESATATHCWVWRDPSGLEAGC